MLCVCEPFSFSLHTVDKREDDHALLPSMVSLQSAHVRSRPLRNRLDTCVVPRRQHTMCFARMHPWRRPPTHVPKGLVLSWYIPGLALRTPYVVRSSSSVVTRASSQL